MTRWLYSVLLRLHPACFRDRFGQQMLSVFDESVRQSGRIDLLGNATVSLLRQRLFRSDAAVARRLNLIFILSVFPLEILVALQLNPKTRLRVHLFCMRYCRYLFSVVSPAAEPRTLGR